jgi:hypothetical protein
MRRVRKTLGVVALVAPVLVVIIGTLLYQTDSATAVGMVTDMRAGLMTYRADIVFTTAAGEEVRTTESVDRPGIGAVRIRYVLLSPWVFNTLDGQYDIGIVALALVLGASFGLAWLALGAGLRSSFNALLRFAVAVGLSAIAAMCLLTWTGSPTAGALAFMIGLLVAFQLRPAEAEG